MLYLFIEYLHVLGAIVIPGTASRRIGEDPPRHRADAGCTADLG
jgi:hypothetical protein